MLHPISYGSNPERQSYLLVDAIAEREAAALQWMVDELGIEQPAPRLARERELLAAAEALGLPALKHSRYPMGAAIRSHLRINDAFRAGRCPAYGIVEPEVTTRADRARRQQRRAERTERVKLIQSMAGQRLTKLEAAELADVGTRTLERKIAEGRVTGYREAGRLRIPAESLAGYLRERYAIAC